MSAATPTRTLSPSGVVTLASADAQFVFKRPRPGVLLIEASGEDVGQFGSSALDEILNALQRERPLELFVDTTAAVSVAPRVREEWTRFFSSNSDRLVAVHVLTGSKLVHLAVAVAQLFSRTGHLIRIYSARAAFEAQLQRAAPSAGAPLKR
jgi:hypothetical protein